MLRIALARLSVAELSYEVECEELRWALGKVWMAGAVLYPSGFLALERRAQNDRKDACLGTLAAKGALNMAKVALKTWHLAWRVDTRTSRAKASKPVSA